MEDLRATADRLGVDLSSLDFDSIHLPPGEDFGIPSDDEDLEAEELEFEEGFGNIILVDNLPVIPNDKFEKLEGAIRRIYGEIGLWMPVDPETQKTLGYCFIEFNTPQEAQLATEDTNGYKLDRSHIFDVIMFDEFDRFLEVPEEWTPPETRPYTQGENLHKWVTDEKARDQFVIRAGMDTEVLWNDARQAQTELVYGRTGWTESFVQWSPVGTYLATVHVQGAAVWGGASTFNRLMRYPHPQVKLIDFSPGERFLVTYSSQEPINPRDTRRIVIKIFDVRTGKVMREFKGSADEFAIGGIGGVCDVFRPVFRWGGGKEDKYFAKIGKDVVSVYETETFTLIDRKSIKVENVVDFSWSPADPVLALFVPELGGGNQPARVSLVQIPSKVELKQKKLFSVCDCKMYWQSNGDYLAVKVDRYTKTKKSTYTGIELFRIKEMSIEVLELENKNDNIFAFAWEPKGHRFAVIHGNDPSPDVSFYSMRSGTHTSRVSKLTSIKGKKANALYWSPLGRFIILAGLKGLDGQLGFYNVDDLETMAQTEHFMATSVEWDPTGRYVATAVTSVHKMENGFNIWSFNGKLLYRILKDDFFQFLWRPRPASFLSPEKEEEIAKNLKRYSKKYEAEDKDVSMLLSQLDREKRKMLKEEWEILIGEWKRYDEEDKLEMQKLREGYDEEEYKVEGGEIVEELFESEEEEVGGFVNVQEITKHIIESIDGLRKISGCGASLDSRLESERSARPYVSSIRSVSKIS